MIGNYQSLYPYILLIALAVAVALIDTIPGSRRANWLSWATAAGALVALALDAGAPESAPWHGILRIDGYARVFNAIFLLTLAIVAIGSRPLEKRTAFAGEYYALLILSTAGLMLMGSSGGLMALYLGLEMSTTCLFALVGFSKREARSAEAALKLLVLGAVASAVMLYGISILYGVLGSTQFDSMAAALASRGDVSLPALGLGIAFVLAGIAFKIAAAPFHIWAPDVYEGAPATVAAYMSTASKAGGFAALLRFLILGMGSESQCWQPAIVIVAALSMVLGNLIALRQTNLKRLLAYSGIAQAGYILVAVAGAPNAPGGMASGAVLMYLFLYAFTNVGGFLVAEAIAQATGSDEITALQGLHRRSPILAFAALVVLFSLGGIPPLAGFVGKIYLFAAGWQGGQWALVLLGALTSVIALYYYLMVALQVYIRDPQDDRRMPIALPLRAAIGVCILATLAIGVYPRPLVAFGDRAAAGLRASTTIIARR